MSRTLHFKFPLYSNEDKPSILNDYNTTITEIDRVLYALSVATGDSEEYERELERLQEEIDNLNIIIQEHSQELGNIQQTLAEVQGLIQDLSHRIDGYDDQFIQILSKLNNKLDKVTDYSFPSQPYEDEEVGMRVIDVPYFERVGMSPPPPELNAYTKWNVFFYSTWNDVHLRVTLPDGNKVVVASLESWKMYRCIMSLRTWIEEPEQVGDEPIEHTYWCPSYIEVLGGSSPTPVVEGDFVRIVQVSSLPNVQFDEDNFVYYLEVQEKYNSYEDVFEDVPRIITSPNLVYIEDTTLEFRVYEDPSTFMVIGELSWNTMGYVQVNYYDDPENPFYDVNPVIQFYQFQLRPATANRLGGIKVGQGLSVENDGTLSVDNQGGSNVDKLDYLLESKEIYAQGITEAYKVKPSYWLEPESSGLDMYKLSSAVQQQITYSYDFASYSAGTGMFIDLPSITFNLGSFTNINIDDYDTVELLVNTVNKPIQENVLSITQANTYPILKNDAYVLPTQKGYKVSIATRAALTTSEGTFYFPVILTVVSSLNGISVSLERAINIYRAIGDQPIDLSVIDPNENITLSFDREIIYIDNLSTSDITISSGTVTTTVQLCLLGLVS